LIGTRGYTILLVYRRFSLEPFFTDVDSSISDGDSVTKFGQRTGKTNGVVKSVRFEGSRPDLALLSSNLVHLPGDSRLSLVHQRGRPSRDGFERRSARGRRRRQQPSSTDPGSDGNDRASVDGAKASFEFKRRSAAFNALLAWNRCPAALSPSRR
jgi:hypothetical protein